jgi:predicted metal-binding membrane protein
MRSRGYAALAVCIGLLALIAWVAIWLAEDTAYAHVLHGHVATAGRWEFVGVFVAGWVVMTTAMMLPTTTPILAVLHGLASRRPDRRLLIALAILGYLAAWTLFGAGVAAAIVSARRFGAGLVAAAPGGLPTAGLLLLAGVYQFTPLKYRCLEQCRTPLAFALSYWQGRRERVQAFRLGLDHGIFCVGCCWALMLLMFVVGLAHLPGMLGLGAVMALEKNVPGGHRLSRPIGIVLLVAGAAKMAAAVLG